MSDNRKRPIARRFKPETEALLQVYAKSRNITANEAAEQLLHGNAGVVVDAAAEIKKLRAAVTRAENVAIAREKQRDDALADLRETNRVVEALTAERDAYGRDVDTLRAELESAREATRRADAEVERLTAEATVRAREYALAAAKLGTENDRLTRELAEAVTSRARLADELASAIEREQRTAAPCACALPANLAPRLAAIAARRDVAPHVMLANVIKNGISKIEASDKYQDAQKAARARA